MPTWRGEGLFLDNLKADSGCDIAKLSDSSELEALYSISVITPSMWTRFLRGCSVNKPPDNYGLPSLAISLNDQIGDRSDKAHNRHHEQGRSSFPERKSPAANGPPSAKHFNRFWIGVTCWC